MTDQPFDHGNHVTDHEPTNGAGLDQPPADHPTTPVLRTLEEAAADLGITVNAVRQRIKRGTLTGIKTDAGWLVDMSVTNDRPTAQRPTTNQATNHTTTPTDPQPTIDLAPLADVIDDLTRRNAELAAAAAMWQTRAAHLEDRLKQLTAGVTPSETVPEPPGSPKTNETGPRGLLDRLLRWWRG